MDWVKTSSVSSSQFVDKNTLAVDSIDITVGASSRNTGLSTALFHKRSQTAAANAPRSIALSWRSPIAACCSSSVSVVTSDPLVGAVLGNTEYDDRVEVGLRTPCWHSNVNNSERTLVKEAGW